MKKHYRTIAAPALLAALLSSLACTNAYAVGNKSWITVGERAYAELQKVAPQAIAKESKFVPVGEPGTKALTERIHLVQVDDEQMLKLSHAIHHELKRCGGFMFHASEADGKRSLEQQAAPVVAKRAAPSYVIDNQAVVPGVLSQMQASNITTTINDLTSFLNRYYTSTGGTDASNWLRDKWAGMAIGRSDISVSQFAHSGYNQKSVILTITGSTNPNEVVVLGGHLDSISNSGSGETMRAPGADDDASGIASMTEALRAMIASGYKPKRTIKFMAYAAEEVGLRGSQAIAQNFKNTNVNVVGVMQLDMTNYKGSPSDIYLYTDYTNAAQNEFLARLVAAYQPGTTVAYSRCGYACSDHASWHNQGFAASFPFETLDGDDNPYIHTANDTYANSGSQAAHALKFAKLAAAFAVELGSDDALPPERVETYNGGFKAGQTKLLGPFKVAAGGSLTASTTGSGDVDLYVRKAAAPTTTTYTCKSDSATAVESCSVSMAENGDAYILLKGYTACSYTLKVAYRPQ